MFKPSAWEMKWHHRFTALAALVSTWSKDPRTKVGAVIVDHDLTILGTGYNGFPRGVADTPERLNNREAKHAFTMHAEANAVMQALATGKPLRNASIYCTHFPCVECAKIIVQGGIKRVTSPLGDDLPGWEISQARAREIFAEAAVTVHAI